MLTAKQRHTRIKFGTAAQRSDTVCWRNTMITDSGIFRMHAMGKPAGSWRTQATRGTVGRPKHSLGVHCLHGHDLLRCHHPQECGGRHRHRHTQTSTKVHQPQNKAGYMGVGSKEYNDVLQQQNIPEGKRPFQQTGRRAEKWELQQDNAPAHGTKENMEFISANVPGGLFLAWPPNSPDLSPIENHWAWMEQQLGDREGINNTDDLQSRLMAITDSITLTQLHAL